MLYEAACNPDPVLRLTGVNRALEGLAIDVFKTMHDFGRRFGDPVLSFCEDWMLADEVTHVKMGSDWLRRLTAKDPERQKQALDFQKAVDKLFSFGGFRGERDENPVHLARKFRRWPGSARTRSPSSSTSPPRPTTRPRPRRRRARRPAEGGRSCCTPALLLDIHTELGLVRHRRQRARRRLGARRALARAAADPRALWWFTALVELAVFVQVGLGVGLVPGEKYVAPEVPHVLRLRRHHRRRRSSTRTGRSCAHRLYLLYGLGGLFVMGLGIRALLVGQ